MTEARHEYIDDIKGKLDELDEKINALEARADETKGDLDSELQSALNSVRETRDKAKQRLDELKSAGEPAWNDVKAGVEQAWQSLSRAVNQASERFQ